MFLMFIEFVLACWNGIIQTLSNTDLGGFSYMQLFVAIGIVSIVVGMLFRKG